LRPKELISQKKTLIKKHLKLKKKNKQQHKLTLKHEKVIYR
jgi:hypothetical protein